MTSAGRTVLMVAYHFPPIRGSSGVQRTLRFAKYLRRHGWRPIVLTIDTKAYEAVETSPGNEIPEGLEVHRAFGLDAARHLAVFGRYPRRMALPDRWATWRFAALRKGSKIISRERIDLVWSTFPIATAHQVALQLSLRSGLPWVAEFRDPMWQGDYPEDPAMNQAWRTLEARVCSRATSIVVTTPSARDLYVERFPTIPRDDVVLIENGYDEEVFARAAIRTPPVWSGDRPVRIVHSGVIYPSERDPTQLFAALANLKRRGVVSAAEVTIVLRATGHDGRYRPQLEELGITDIVQLAPPLGYAAAIEELMSSDGLLLLQAANCNAQIPAKLYEYLRAGRPILALTDRTGDTARTLESLDTGLIARLDSVPEIEAAVEDFIRSLREGRYLLPSRDAVKCFSRESQTDELAALLDRSVDRSAQHSVNRMPTRA